MLLAQPSGDHGGERPLIRQGNLTEGEAAPDFYLHDLANTNSVNLSHLKGKPVVLIFGSCTCPPFVATLPSTERLFATYKGRAHFYIIYIREAHPTDKWTVPNNRFQVKTPTSIESRNQIATSFARKLNVSIPILVDSIDDPVETTYACWPNRMYIIDARGKIADKGLAESDGVGNSLSRASEVLNKLLADEK